MAKRFVWLLALTLLGGGVAGEPTPGCPADTLLVMGAAQYDGVPSPAFARRLDRAFELYEAGCAEKILVTGGKRPGDRFTEGEAGVRYLAARGVPETALLKETKSRSSLQNLRYSLPLVRGERVLIVTDDLHTYRTGFLAQELGLDATVTGVPTKGPRLPYLLREAASVTAYLLGRR
ncbi:YdcF family protein [Truepera radiovictrix]|uniref:DUF218 domain-containing protein n=1 Tax=Truepera radiovictrix (strain DSM 17093 / CIP 108686 / LMG 22925 / RQ-24) TaxID=649638 RepID=D7CWX0_TRURR|nr:YdcF family protein [Truepera radiovictrix]ADI14478.1 protein of unknown function DUF218 [Truepera radiovictrix DSM 17093]WMT56967.1 YdcF family protein [Truepera radiovictrix]